MKPIISFNVPDKKVKEELKKEATLRGHNSNQAMLQIFELGLEIYKEKVPVKFKPVDSSAEMPVEV